MDGVYFIYSLKRLSKLIKCTCGTSPSPSCFTYHYHNIYDDLWKIRDRYLPFQVVLFFSLWKEFKLKITAFLVQALA